jgi:hypothetical protein
MSLSNDTLPGPVNQAVAEMPVKLTMLIKSGHKYGEPKRHSLEGTSERSAQLAFS